MNEELTSFFADPEPYKKAARQRIVASLLERSERYLAEKRTPRALASLNQVLALDGQNARALAMLDGLNRAKRRRLWVKRGIQTGVTLAVLTVLGTGGYFFFRSRPPPPGPVEPVPSQPTPKPPEPARAIEPPLQPPALLPVPPEATRPGPSEASPPEESSTVRKPPVRPEPARPSKVRVSILVRPYGSIQVDNEAPSPQPLAQHDLELPPGSHTVTVRCEWCEDATETIDVAPGAENVFRLRAQLKPSRLSFDYQPADAQVRVGDSAAHRAREPGAPLRHPLGLGAPPASSTAWSTR